MLKTKLFRRYFAIYSTLVIISILVLGVILFTFASRFFEREKYGAMERYMSQAVMRTAESYRQSGGMYVESADIAYAYNLVSMVIGGEIYLTDIAGEVLFYSSAGVGEQFKLTLGGAAVPSQIANLAASQGYYTETGTMMGFYNRIRYTVAIPVTYEGMTFGLVFASCPAGDLTVMLIELLKMFAISAVVVLALASGIIYIVTARMVYPLKIMLEATNSFSRGDFSKRVPVSAYDEIGQLSMAFNNMASSLSNTESARRSFVANVSHELKTPMTTISGFVDGILDGTIPEEKREHYLNLVSNECKRLSRLVRSMLDTSRIEAGELEVNPVVFDISETIRQAVFAFEQSIDEAGLEIKGLDADKVMVFADKDLMHQVVYNLVDNAVKFVNPGGYISFSYKTEGKMTHISIRNSGKGIERGDLTKLFDRFYKSDRSRSLNTGGAGLGLHIARTIVKYHSGEITAESVPGEYAEFRFSVPSAGALKE